jgi:predicted dinucleotide-binding enzyme
MYTQVVLWKEFVLLLSIFLVISDALSTSPKTVVILGGTGRIGTAVATHLLRRAPELEIILVGRREQGQASIEEVLTEHPKAKVSYSRVETIWQESPQLENLFAKADCVIHTAGPYLDRKPIPLKLAIASERCKVYVDVSDPLPFLETSLLMDEAAKASRTTAVVAAGAFPGMSNVLAVEAASKIEGSFVNDVRFNYFTAGLGGAGVVNLYITNLGFGESMAQYDNGELRFFMALSGILLGKVDFFLPNISDKGNQLVKERVGTQTVFAWPFPEAATAPKSLKARGNSYAAMGTAPDIWNAMLGILVSVVPRPWWKNAKFSKWMADFSQPLVLATDAWLKLSGLGETHVMRVDVTAGREGRDGGVSIVQAHDSFRQCVGQSCAEFCLDILQHPDTPGVYLPEQRYRDHADRQRILKRLTTTPGTFCYTGPVRLETAPNPPSDWQQAINQASQAETTSKI